MEIPENLLAFEDGFAATVLETSQNRRKAQDKLIGSRGVSRAEAHRLLNAMADEETRDLAVEYGYNIAVNGVSFAGYAMGPMLVGGFKGQQIAADRGSYDPSTGLLTDETETGARAYCSHICSYAEYRAGVAKLIITNPGGAEPQVQVIEGDD